MNIFGIVHILSALFTVVFVVYTLYNVFHKSSIEHRATKLRFKIKPLILGKNSKQHIISVLSLDGFPKEEIEEVYDILISEMPSKK